MADIPQILIQAKLRQDSTTQINKQIEDIQKQAKLQLNVDIDTKTAKAALKDLQNQPILKMQSDQLNSRITTWMNNNTRAAKIYDNQLQQVLTDTQNINSKSDLTKVSQQFKTIQRDAEAVGVTGQTVLGKFSSDMKNFLTFVSAGTILMTLVNSVKSMYNSVVELDTAMVELRKVTDETENTYNSFYHSANDTAKALGITTAAVINATAQWAQMGYSIKDATALAKDSAIFSNISENMDIGTATSTLVSTVKAFGLNTNDVLDGVISKINELGNQFAVTNTDVATGLKESAAAMAVANNSLDQTAALITGITEVTQDASAAGNALKTISMRIRGMDEETGTASDDLKDMAKNIKGLTGVSVFTDKTNQTYKSTYDILKQISGIFSTLSDKSQAEVLELLAGKRQGNVVAAALTNFTSIEKAMTVEANSAGGALREQATYMDSINAHVNTLKETFVGFAQDTINSGLVKTIVDFGTDLGIVTDKIGITGIALITLTALFLKFNNSLLVNSLGSFSIMLGEMIPALGSLSSGLIAATGASGALATAMDMIPLLAIVGACVAAYKAFDYFNVTAEESKKNVEDLTNAYTEATSKLTTLQSSLKTTQDRITELQSKGSLTIVEQAELTKLQQTNSDLEAQIKLQKELADIAGKKASDAALENANRTDKTSIYQTHQINAPSTQNIAGGNLPVANQITDVDYVKEQIQNYNELSASLSKLDKAYLAGTVSKEEYTKQSADLKAKETDAHTAIVTTTNAIDTNAKSVLDNTDEGKAYLATVKDINDAVLKHTQLVNNDTNANSSKTVTTTGEDNITKLNAALTTLQSTYDKIPTTLKDIDDIQTKLNEGYSFSYDEIEKLKAAHPELESAIRRTADGWTIEKSAVDTLRTSTLNLSKEFVDAQNTMTTIMNSEVAKRLEQYGIELDGIKSLSDAYDSINKKNAEITKQEKDIGVPHAALGSLDSEAQDTILSVGKAQDTINKLKNQLKDIGGGTSVSGGKSNASKSGSSSSTENTALKNAEATLAYDKEMGKYTSDNLYKQIALNQAYEKATENLKKYAKTTDEIRDINEKIKAAQDAVITAQKAYQQNNLDESYKELDNRKALGVVQENSAAELQNLLEIQKNLNTSGMSLVNTAENRLAIEKKILDVKKAMLDTEQSALDDYEKAAEAVIDKQISTIEKQETALEKSEKKKEERADKHIKQLQAEEKELETSYNAQIKVVQAKIDALQNSNDETSKQIALEKAQAALEEAQNQKSISIYQEGKGFVYQSDQSAITTAKENVASAKYDIEVENLTKEKEKLQTALDDQKQALEDNIQEWEDYKTELSDKLDKQKEKLEDQIDSWNDYKDAFASVTTDYELSQQELLLAQTTGAQTESDILAQRLGVVNSFKDSYLALQKQIASYASNIQASAAKIQAAKAVMSSSKTTTATKHANGIDKVLQSEIANVDDGTGTELIVHAPSSGRLTSLEYGDTVYNGDATKNIMDKLSASTSPQSIISSQLSTLQPNLSFVAPNNGTKTTTVQNHFDKLELSNVTDANSFINELKKFDLDMIQSLTKD